MFWSKDKDKKKSGVGTKEGHRQSGDDLRAQAMANARAAKETIGEETIQRIAVAMQKKQNSPTERAKADIANADIDKVSDEILWMLGDKD